MIFKKAKKLIISTIDHNLTKLTKDSSQRANKNNYKAKNYSMQNKFSKILMDFSEKGRIIYQVIFLNLIEEEKQSSYWLLKSIVKVTLCL